MTDVASIVFTGRNTAEVRAFVDSAGAPDGETWFLTRNQSAPTGGQAWRYVKGGAAWADTVIAAVYDPAYGDWQPVERGDIIRRGGSTLMHRFFQVETS